MAGMEACLLWSEGFVSSIIWVKFWCLPSLWPCVSTYCREAIAPSGYQPAHRFWTRNRLFFQSRWQESKNRSSLAKIDGSSRIENKVDFQLCDFAMTSNCFDELVWAISFQYMLFSVFLQRLSSIVDVEYVSLDVICWCGVSFWYGSLVYDLSRHSRLRSKLKWVQVEHPTSQRCEV